MPWATKRRFQRFNLELPITVECTSRKSTTEVIVAKTQDVSAGGAFVNGAGDIALGSCVHVGLVLDGGASFADGGSGLAQMAAKVVRMEPQGFALQFEQRHRITHLESPDQWKV